MEHATETFQIPLAAAEVYESKFVPALFAEWAPHMLNAAGVTAGSKVLDVATGTGIVARTAADVVGRSGRVVGLDLNEAMLTVARRVRPGIEWRQGDAANLPFDDSSFDAVLCQMALMFFPDRRKALQELARVVTSAGAVAVLVPSRLSSQPAYAPFVEMVVGQVGPEAASLLGAYFACGDLEELTALVESADLQVVERRTRMGRARFDSVDGFVETEVKSTPLMERISGETYQRILAGARNVLKPYTSPSRSLDIPFEGQLVVSRKRRAV